MTVLGTLFFLIVSNTFSIFLYIISNIDIQTKVGYYSLHLLNKYTLDILSTRSALELRYLDSPTIFLYMVIFSDTTPGLSCFLCLTVTSSIIFVKFSFEVLRFKHSIRNINPDCDTFLCFQFVFRLYITFDSMEHFDQLLSIFFNVSVNIFSRHWLNILLRKADQN